MAPCQAQKPLRPTQLGIASKIIRDQRGIGPEHRAVHHQPVNRILRSVNQIVKRGKRGVDYGLPLGESTAVHNAEGRLQLYQKPSFDVVSSAAQLLVVLPAAEPAHTGSPGVGGNLGGRVGEKKWGYPSLRCGFLTCDGCRTFLQYRRKGGNRIL